MLMDQATFEGMKAQLIQLWQQMNTTFKDYSFDETFNTPWYWQQTYENSLRAQVDYFRQLMFRFDEAITEKNSILAGNKTLLGPYSQWYQQTLESLRTEMKREGGITWVIKDAWYLNFAPTVFWEPIQFFMLCVIFAIIIIYVLFGIEGE